VKSTTKDEETKATTDAEKAESSPAGYPPASPADPSPCVDVLDSQTRAVRTNAAAAQRCILVPGRGTIGRHRNVYGLGERALKRTLNGRGALGRRFGRTDEEDEAENDVDADGAMEANSVNETGVAQVNGRHAVTSDTEDERNAADKDFKPVFLKGLFRVCKSL